jgi:large subunit ribosomal protein L27e
MVKFYKPGKIVVVLNGRFAGRKGIIVKSNYESVKDRKYPHCMVVGLSHGPRKPTRKNIAKLQAKINKLESQENTVDRIKQLKSFGVFIKNYNMSHLLATRYTLKDELGIAKSVAKIDELVKKVKEDKIEIDNKEKSKKEENAKELENLKSKYGQELDDYKNEQEVDRRWLDNYPKEIYKLLTQGYNLVYYFNENPHTQKACNEIYKIWEENYGKIFPVYYTLEVKVKDFQRIHRLPKIFFPYSNNVNWLMNPVLIKLGYYKTIEVKFQEELNSKNNFTPDINHENALNEIIEKVR